jgi:hypothetical protein
MHPSRCCVIGVTLFLPNSTTVKPILFGPPRVFNFLARSADTFRRFGIFVMEALHVQPLTLQRFLFLGNSVEAFRQRITFCNQAHAKAESA